MPSTKHLNRYKLVENNQAAAAEAPARGRPRGKPKPLTQAERRERNAHLERGRRDTMADAYDLLRSALNQGTLTRAETLMRARDFIARDRSGPSAADLRRQNECLMKQIDILQKRLGVSSETDEDEEPECPLQPRLASERQASQLSKSSHSGTQSDSENDWDEAQTTDSENPESDTEFYPSTQPNKIESPYELKQLDKKETQCKSESGPPSNSDVPKFSTHLYSGLHAIVPDVQVKSKYNDSYTREETQIVPDHNPMLSATSYSPVNPLANHLYHEQTGAYSGKSPTVDDIPESPSYCDGLPDANELYHELIGVDSQMDDISESTSSFCDVKPLEHKLNYEQTRTVDDNSESPSYCDGSPFENELYQELTGAYSEESQTVDDTSESPSYCDATPDANELFHELTGAYSGESQMGDDIPESASYCYVKPFANKLYYERTGAYSEESQ